VQLKLLIMLYAKFFGPVVPLFYSSVGIGPSNRFSFRPAVPLFISNASVAFLNYFLSGLQCPRFI
jgi:hypothetical protein